tara:strand:+ start:360 stop:797 length:438 start_codon:yes stop_codon:yes gene_type:complete
MVRGKKLSNKEFNKLSIGKQGICNRNRIAAMRSKDKRKNLISLFEKENMKLNIYIELLETEINIIFNSKTIDLPQFIKDKSYTMPLFPIFEYKSFKNIKDKKEKNRIYAHNSRMRIQNKIYELEIMNSILKERIKELEEYIDNLI